ncbi:MAG: Sir2 silent information regulator family NAD-dependent deacetylase [Bacteroidaceae bacterium]|nr:Sir2 silent information regulator family NAD-dependent deacetylase [Bacteroidaceae bacterium]
MIFTKSFTSRIEEARELIDDADYLLIGAGAGLSAAAGLTYSGKTFEQEFQPWIQRYHITELYTSSFYPFETEEERWAYWAKHIWFARFRIGATPLYRQLLELVSEKPYFVLTTNVDAQFEKAGFKQDKIFATQGDYAYLQASSGENKTLVYNEEWVKEAIAATHDCRIPTEMIPRHPETGEALSPNLRCNDTFVEDAHWHQQAKRYRQFIKEAKDKRLVLLEFGVGYNTPGIIRFPFEAMAAGFPQTSLIRFNANDIQLFTEGVKRYIPFTEDINRSLTELEQIDINIL